MRKTTTRQLGAALSLLIMFGFTFGAAAQSGGRKGLSLPAHAQEIEPGVYYLGRVKDYMGRDIDGVAFVHSRKLAAKPGGAGGGHTTSDPCYAFLYSGVHWKTPENYVVSPTIAGAPDGALFLDEISVALDNWEAAAGTQIFGSGMVGDVDLDLIGNGINGVNEVTFAPIDIPDFPGVIGITYVWGVFNGSRASRELTEWDIVLDNVDYTWSATGEKGKMDFWNVFAHESGHAAGMAHPSDTCADETMYRYISYGETKKRTLNAGDTAGIAALYK